MSHRLRITTLFALCLVALSFTASAHAGIPFYVEGGISDNYKASFNANPQAQELRTWLSMDRIDAAGSLWTPVTPSAITFASPLTLTSQDGRTGTLTITSMTTNISSVTLRVDPPSDKAGLRWGPLVTMRSAISATNPKARIGLSLTTGGNVIATGILDYWSTTFAGTGASIENNGPNGRWRIEGYPLDTDWEPGSTPSGSLTAVVPLAPHVTGVIASRRGTLVSVRATARASQRARVVYSRYRIGTGRYTAWRKSSLAYAFRLSAGSKARVSMQVRDVRGFVSPIVIRSVG